MKFFKGILGLLLSLCLIQGTVVPVAAAGNYTYTVRFFSGKQGDINGEEVAVISGLQYGDRVTFDRRSVSLENGSKYYIKGIRESGKDNNTVSATSFVVTGDQDYVVAYGILGNAVAYTIHYVDTEGNTLAPSETFYGNVGDKPVIAFLYIEGYQPNAYNLVKTLSANAAENVFTFTYSAVEEGAEGDATIEDNVVIESDGTEDSQEGGDGLADGNADTDGTSGAEGDDVIAPPVDLMDLDDEDTPLGNFLKWAEDVLEEVGATIVELPLAAKILLTTGGAALLGGLLWYLLIHRKKKKKEEEQAEPEKEVENE